MDPFALFPVVFFGITAIIVGTILVAVVKGIAEWSDNNARPVLSVPAQLVSKRTRVSGGSNDASASTWYYVTYELQSGERREFGVRGREYGMLAEGDVGTLTYQGTRYKGFTRGGVSA